MHSHRCRKHSCIGRMLLTCRLRSFTPSFSARITSIFPITMSASRRSLRSQSSSASDSVASLSQSGVGISMKKKDVGSVAKRARSEQLEAERAAKAAARKRKASPAKPAASSAAASSSSSSSTKRSSSRKKSTVLIPASEVEAEVETTKVIETPAKRTKVSKASTKKKKIAASSSASSSSTEFKFGTSPREMESALYAQGKKIVIGVDEAGRGPLAGPVVACAIYIPQHITIEGVNDSKILTESQRESLFTQLTTHKEIFYTTCILDHLTIDRINILEATLQSMQTCVDLLNAKLGAPGKLNIDHVFIDGNIVPKTLKHSGEAVVKGDSRVYSIAAASIIAKVTRDRIMVAAHEQYPQYNFAQHKGYGTAAHMGAIHRHGPCAIHRMTFAPMKHMKSKTDGGKEDKKKTNKKPVSKPRTTKTARRAVVKDLTEEGIEPNPGPPRRSSRSNVAEASSAAGESTSSSTAASSTGTDSDESTNASAEVPLKKQKTGTSESASSMPASSSPSTRKSKSLKSSLSYAKDNEIYFKSNNTNGYAFLSNFWPFVDAKKEAVEKIGLAVKASEEEKTVSTTAAAAASSSVSSTSDIATAATSPSSSSSSPSSTPSLFTIDSLSYPSVEHYYQSQKFITNQEIFNTIRTASTSLQAKQLNTKYRKVHTTPKEWFTRENQMKIMKQALVAKFTQNVDLKTALLATNDMVLHETRGRSKDLWCYQPDLPKEESDALGRLLMEVREELKAELKQTTTQKETK